MIDLVNNTPQIYSEESRDFQLFLRLYNCIINGVKYDIDTIPDILDPFKANDRILNLLCTRVGFFPKREYDSTLLRYIIESFCYIIKNKGTKKGIEAAISTILKVEGDFSQPKVIIQDNHVEIYTSVRIYNKKALEELLYYVLPIGFTYNVSEFSSVEHQNRIYYNSGTINILKGPSISISQIRGNGRILDPSSSNSFDFKTELQDKYVGSYIASEIIGSENYLTTQVFESDNTGISRDTIDTEEQFKEGTINREGAYNGEEIGN